MMKTYLLLSLFLLWGCTNSLNARQDGKKNSTTFKTIHVKKISADSLSLLLGFKTNPMLRHYFKGHYGVLESADATKVLDGPFQFTIVDRLVASKDAFETPRKFSLAYKGNFSKGKMHGALIEELHYDDGKDLFFSWTINLKYFESECHYAVFDGQIGFQMPKANYIFYDLKECNFTSVEELALEQWKANSKNSKNKKG
jgi:hypothetical protein